MSLNNYQCSHFISMSSFNNFEYFYNFKIVTNFNTSMVLKFWLKLNKLLLQIMFVNICIFFSELGNGCNY